MAPLLPQTLHREQENVEPILNAQTPIQQFYENKSIFITGGTGFLGKIIMEKLLRVCDIENIYILVRSKKGKDVDTRIEDIFCDPLYERLKTEHPKFRHKIVPIVGDCALPGLGISHEDRQILERNVNIVFHVAATVRFDEKLKLALEINVCGTNEILTLCREFENLLAMVHVSTAYANCTRMDIEEKLYKTVISAENAVKLTEIMDDKTLDKITPHLIGKWPNTYTFSKSLAEDLIRTKSKGLPVAVFRPAIVIPTYKEPIAGWIDNMYGATGIIVGVGVGLLRVLQINQDNHAEIVPVDMCVNSLLCSAWDIASSTYDEPPVYNFVTSQNNKITWRQFYELSLCHGRSIPFSKSIWHYTFTMSSNWFLVALMKFFYHIIPAFLMDAGLLIVGKKPRMLQIYRKIHHFCRVLTYFTSGKWQFPNRNVKNLFLKLNDADKELFYFDMDDLSWNDVMGRQLIGLRTYLMKDSPDTLPYARKRSAVLKYLHYFIICSIYALIGWIFYLLFKKFTGI